MHPPQRSINSSMKKLPTLHISKTPKRMCEEKQNNWKTSPKKSKISHEVESTNEEKRQEMKIGLLLIAKTKSGRKTMTLYSNWANTFKRHCSFVQI